MYRDSFAGTADELKTHVASMKLPDDMGAPEAVRAFILAHVPTYGVSKWKLSISCESEQNQGGNRIAGFLSVAVQEV